MTVPSCIGGWSQRVPRGGEHTHHEAGVEGQAVGICEERNSTQQCAGMGHGHTAPLRTASAEVIHALVHVVSIATETRCPRAPKQAPTMTLGLEMSKGMIGQRGTRVGYLARLSPFAGILEGRCRCPPALEKSALIMAKNGAQPVVEFLLIAPPYASHGMTSPWAALGSDSVYY